jgi:hypothetical protein
MKRVCIFLIMLALIAGMVGCNGGGTTFYGGSGTDGDPYQIADWYQLHNVRNYLDSHFILVNNLDSTTAGYEELSSPTANGGKGWEPIGGIEIIVPDPLEFELVDPFTGSFDGQGYEIRDLFIDRPDEDAVALFGSVSGGAIENATLLDANITGNGGVGILVGANLGSVSSCCSSGSVGGYYGVGGLIGANFGNVSDSRSRATVIGVHDASGGLVGFNAGNLSQCYAIGNVSCNDHVGGLVGMNGEDTYYGTVTDSYASGDVNGVSYVGGLVGDNYDGTVSDSYASGRVTGENDVGGLVGRNFGTVSDSFWDTETSGEATSAGGTGKTTVQMKDFTTFLDAGWDIITVANSDTRNTGYIWNIVDDATYPFLSWQPV